MPQRIDYQVRLPAPHTHRFSVTLKIARPQAKQRLSLPVWIPGSYLVREFARHLSPITARQDAHEIGVTPIDKSTWELDCSDREAVMVSYEVYAFDTSVRAAFLDSGRGFFNGTSVFLRVEGQDTQVHRLHLMGAPKGWRVGTALSPLKVNAQGWGAYEARDYDELVDHPVEMGPFWQGGFSVRGVRHDWVVAGAPPDFDGDKLLADCRRICEAQIQFWHGRGKPDFKHYVFLLNAVDDGYGGLEHRRSTALICSRKDLPRTGRAVNDDGYTTLLGLISHEYFHTWNVKRLKPTDFAPYDYTRENHTRMLWFFEGFTSYYDDQFLLRTGLLDAKAYLKLLGRTVNQVLATPGREHHSAAQASFDAWIRYYRPDENTANATVNYYTKGALVALCLDLALRSLPEQAPQPAASLDGVMARLWRLKRPITHADVAEAVAQEAGTLAPPAWTQPRQGGRNTLQPWADLLHRWTETPEELPLRAALDALAVEWLEKPAPLPQRLGLRLSDQGGVLKVMAVMRDSVAESTGLQAGDEWLGLDGWRVRKADDIQQWLDVKRGGQTLVICRDGRLLNLSLAPMQAKPPALVALGLSNTDVTDKRSRRQAWLST